MIWSRSLLMLLSLAVNFSAFGGPRDRVPLEDDGYINHTVRPPLIGDFAGIYRGLSPTDESALVAGEIEVTVTEKLLKINMATGITVLAEEIPLDGFVQMTDSEVSAFYKEGTDFPRRSVGFKGPSGYPQLLFLQNPSTNRFLPARSEYGLIIKTGGMSDMLGPTVLLAPGQLEKISCESFLRSFEFWRAGSWRGGLIPRLNNNGLAPRQQ